ncbi:MAG: mandelate racemase/muconate lactonizing enzyme family protein [Anaerolineales bacterium]
MRITDIKSYPVWIAGRNLLVVKVETDAGFYGLGESGLSSREQAVMGAIRHYREFLIGQDPTQRGRIWQELYRSQYFEGGRVLLAAQSAIDIALHDLTAKAWGVPVYQLLGGQQREFVPGFATAYGFTGEEVLAGVRVLAAHGWKAIRTAPVQPGQPPEARVYEPRDTIAPTVAMLTQARAEIGTDIALGLDYHHRLSLAETASFCQRLPSGTLDFLEEPIRDESPEAYAALRQLTHVPLAVGEEFSSKWQFAPFLERHLTDYVRVDICNVGGFTEAMKVAGWAEAHYLDLMPHNPLGPISTAANIHLAAAVPNYSWLEMRDSETENLAVNSQGVDEGAALFPLQPRRAGTGYPVPEGPGLGVELDEALAQAQNWHFVEFPHWRRGDGSVTNW